MHLNPFSNLHYFVVCVVLLPPPHSALLAPLLHDCDNYSSTSTIGGSSTRHGRTRYPQRCAMPCSPHVRPVDGCCRQRLGCGRCTLATYSRPHYRGQSKLSDRPDLAFLLSAQSVPFDLEPKYGIQSLFFHTPGGCMYPMPRETSCARSSERGTDCGAARPAASLEPRRVSSGSWCGARGRQARSQAKPSRA